MIFVVTKVTGSVDNASSTDANTEESTEAESTDSDPMEDEDIVSQQENSNPEPEEPAANQSGHKTFSNKCFSFEYPGDWADEDVVASDTNCHVTLPNFSEIIPKVNKDRSETENFSYFNSLEDFATQWIQSTDDPFKLDGIDAYKKDNLDQAYVTLNIAVLTTSPNYGARGFLMIFQPSDSAQKFTPEDAQHILDSWQWMP